MAQMRLSGLQRIAQLQRVAAATGLGEHRVIARLIRTGQPSAGAAVSAAIRTDADAPDLSMVWIDGPLDAEDEARALMGFRGQPNGATPGMSYVRSGANSAASCDTSAYVCDEESGMVYLLD